MVADGQPAPVRSTRSPRPRPAHGAAIGLAERYAAHQEATLFGPREESVRSPAEPRLRYLGQLDRTYLVCETPGELVLVDQHAAHERIAFQRLRAAHEPRVQRLLLPRPLELSPEQARVAIAEADALAKVGFELEPIGGHRFGLRGAAAELRDADVMPALLELLGKLASGAGGVSDHVDAMLATIACHSVVRAGDSLGEDEARALLSGLDDLDLSGPGPHGRPVLLRLGIAELSRRFGRT